MKKQEELLVIEPIIGYREWNIYCEKKNGKYKFRLEGNGVGAKAGFWTNGINKAKCLKSKLFNHKPPNFKCECGFYAHKYKIDIIKELLRIRNPASSLFSLSIFNDNSNISLYGIVELTGKVIEHSEGYRAEKAEVKKLIWVDERNKIDIIYENKDKKDKQEEKENKDNITNTCNGWRFYIQQQTTQSRQLQVRSGYSSPNLPLSSQTQPPHNFGIDWGFSTTLSKTFPKDKIIKSLTDYYQVPIIYYKDYLEKELLK